MPFYPLAKVERGYIDKHFPLGQEGTLLWGEQFVCFPLGLGGVARVKVATGALQLMNSRMDFGGRMEVAVFCFCSCSGSEESGRAS